MSDSGKVTEFKNKTPIQSLHGSLQPFITKTHNEDPVTIRAKIDLDDNNRKLKLVEALIESLFPRELTDGFKWYSVLPGSVCVVFLVPYSIQEALIQYSKQKISFMRLVGVFNLQVGDAYVLQDKEPETFTFLNSVKVGNYEAVGFLFLLDHIHVDVNLKIKSRSYRKVKQ